MLFIFLALVRCSSSSPRFLGSMKVLEPKGSDAPAGLDERFQLAALSSEACFCGNQLHAPVLLSCFDTSLSEETKDVRRGSDQQEGNQVLRRTQGTFNKSESPNRPAGFCVSGSSSSDLLHSQLPVVIVLLLGPLEVPSRDPSASLDLDSCPAAAACFCDPVTLQARVREVLSVAGKKKMTDVCIFSCESLKQTEASDPSSCHLTQAPTHSVQMFTCQRPAYTKHNKAVRICATKQAIPTNTDVTFLAVTDTAHPVEFFWDFGDSRSVRTASRTITKRYQNPGSYHVVAAAAFWAQTVLTSDVFLILVQRAVELSRLVHQASVLKNQTVTVSCRVNAGTDLTFTWSFGDGSARSGLRTTQHVFNRTGEFTIKVVVSNCISSASLSSLIFVVDRPCRPPPVKNMGPFRLQVWRFEVVRLGVTFESDVECDGSAGLRYSWTLSDSAGRVVQLPLRDKHERTLVLRSRVLQYDTYTATARVQILSSVVYSNYTVRLQVVPSPLVAFIQGGTNVFIDKKSTKTITLDGRASYDPDFPLTRLSYSWTCKPVSTVISSCFHRDVPASSPELKFPVSLLKPGFDQFRYRLTVHSEERSASSEIFLTVTSDLIRKVSVHCDQCRGDAVNWDQSFSVAATCDDCGEPVRFSWTLNRVNESSKTASDVPFCSTADVGAPTAVVEAPAVSVQIRSESARSVQTSDPSRFLEKLSVMKSEKQNNDLSGSDSEPLSDPTGRSDPISNFTFDPDSSADWEESSSWLESSDGDFQQTDTSAGPDDYDAPFPAEEGDSGMSAGRPKGVGFGTPSPGPGWVLNQDQGSNLMHPKPSESIQERTLLDLHRDPIDGVLFESYTYTGISSSLLRFKPFSLRPNTRYMLEVTAKSQQKVLGRTQLFIKTNPVPEGVTCQVQPAEGAELHTHFSVFCMSGHQDLLYEYSFSVRGGPRRVLYRGRDFQYYFSLPSGDPSDDYKVTIHIEIRSGRFGSTTKPCSVSVRVKPSFFSSSSPRSDSDMKLSESGLGTLSALLQLRNPGEVRNHVSLLCRVLNRLGRAAEAQAPRRLRNALICTVCELESEDQTSVEDNICILSDLLQATNQVTLMSVRQVTSHVQVVSEQFSELVAADQNHRILNSLIGLLSHGLQVISSCDHTPESPDANFTENAPDRCITDFKHAGLIPVKRLVGDILLTASDLMLKHILFQETKEHRVVTDLLVLHTASLNHTSTTIRSNLTTVYLPASLIQTVFARLREPNPCVLTVLIESSRNPYCWASRPVQLTGPVVSLHLYRCSTRRSIHVGSLPQPISFELRHPQRKRSSATEYTLLRSRINYHNFTISQELLHHAVQVTVVFTPPLGKRFPIMLLFRMFERPTPSMHHLQRTHEWESNTVRFTLPPSYINAAGVGHLALLDANFERAPGRKQRSEQTSYSLVVDSGLCLSWDEQQGTWTHRGCRTRRLDTTVNCSCSQLRPLTVFQQQIQSSHDSADLDQFLSVSSNLTVFSLLMLLLVLFIPGLAWCHRADVVSEETRRVHYLSDNDPEDSCFYAVCIHTGLCSAACMTAKVFIVLCGEHGVSLTKELQVPGCTLFRRNSKDTFILSVADCLGPVWGVHIWHDNSGPFPDWYIKQVTVSEVRGGQVGRSWRFVSESWLAVNKDDGRVERMLRVRGLGFARMLFLRFSDYLAEFHIWTSVYSCSWPNSFPHTRRLGVCVLLLLGYAAVNAVVVTQMDDPLDSSPGVCLTAGLLSVAVVLPAATFKSFLFRLCGIKRSGSGVQPAPFRSTVEKDSEVRDTELDSHPSHLWTQEKYQDRDILSVSTTRENKDTNKRSIIQAEGHSLTSDSGGFLTQKTSRNEGQTFQNKRRSAWCLLLTWTLCLLTSLLCLGLSATLGIRFSSSQVLLWIQSLFVSFTSCIFFVQPALLFAVAVVVSVWRKKAPASSSSSSLKVETLNLCSSNERVRESAFPERTSHFEKLLGARQRARHLRLLRPPTPSELRKTRFKRRREALIHKTPRDLFFCAAMLLLMTCATYYSSFKDHYQLNRAVKRHFIRKQGFIGMKMHEDWWKWTQTTLLDLLDQRKSDKTELSHVGIGDLVIKKTERCHPAQMQVSSLRHFWTSDRSSCSSEEVVTVVLGQTKSDAAAELQLLRSSGWVDGRTVALKVRFTLAGPAPNLFTGVTLLTEQSPGGALRPSVKVRSVRVDAAGGDRVVVVCQLLFLLLFLLQLCDQVSTAAQQGLMGNWRTPSTCLDLSLLTVIFVYYVCCVYRSVAMTEVVNFLQERSNERHVDVSDLSTWEQYIRSLHGIILFLLLMKTVTVLRVNRTLSFSAAVLARSLSSLLSPPSSGLVLLVVSFCLGKLLCTQSSGVFSSLRSLLWNDWGLSGPGFSPCGVLLLSASVVWTAVVIGTISSSVRRTSRRPQSRRVLTTAEMFSYFKKKVSESTGRQRRAKTDHHEEERTFLLEELEISVDELLFRLGALSNIIHHPLLPKPCGCRNKDFPTPRPSDTEDLLRSQPMLKEPTHESYQRPASCLFRPLAQQEVQKFLYKRRNHKHYRPGIFQESSDEFRNKSCLYCPKSTSVSESWDEDFLETNSSCSFSKTHSEVLVEVQVHKEQETEESDVLI